MKKRNPRLYEIHTVQWLHELREKYSFDAMTLSGVPGPEWDRLQKLGFQFVWLMGAWKRSRAGVETFKGEEGEYRDFREYLDSVMPRWTEEDLVGSPYSIAAYEPDPLVGSDDELVHARKELNRRGMGLILDFVPNHTAPDFPWVHSRPDYYVRGSEEDYRKDPRAFTPVSHKGKTIYIARGQDPYFPPWSDTLQLDYFNPETRAALIGEMKRISRYCDGLRCDMAMLVLNDIFAKTWAWAKERAQHAPSRREFWTEARHELDNIFLIAEAYWDTEWRLLELGFDYVYDKRLYDRLRDSQAGDVLAHLRADVEFQRKLVRFVENHDEPRGASAFREGRLRPAVVAVATLPGMRLFHHGQLEGRQVKSPLQLRRRPEEAADEEVEQFYEKVLAVTDAPAFHDGKWELREVNRSEDDSHIDLIAYVWHGGGSLKLVVINLGERPSQGFIPLGGLVRPEAGYILHDGLDGSRYLRSGEEMAGRGLHVVLGGFNSHIFDIAPTAHSAT